MSSRAVVSLACSADHTAPTVSYSPGGTLDPVSLPKSTLHAAGPLLHFLANAMNIMHTVPERADALACGSRDIAMEAIDRDAKSAGARATVL